MVLVPCRVSFWQVRFEPIVGSRSLKECELQSGDIIVFQAPASPRLQELANTCISDSLSESRAVTMLSDDVEMLVDEPQQLLAALPLEGEREPEAGSAICETPTRIERGSTLSN